MRRPAKPTLLLSLLAVSLTLSPTRSALAEAKHQRTSFSSHPDPGVQTNEAPQQSSSAAPARKILQGSFRGWNHLVQKLFEAGVDEKRLRSTYTSKRIPRFESVPFSVSPKESQRIYQQFFRAKELKIATNFLKKHSSDFAGAEKHFGVSRYVVGAIIYVETKCGAYTGREMVLYRLSRLAAIAEPDNVKKNYERLKKEDSTLKLPKVRDRAEYLEEMFLPEIPALFEIARRNKINIFNIRGSRAGAFGLPQFLPSTYLKFGYDGNRDGKVSLFTPADAIYSAANFLASFGWKDSLPLDKKKQVVWKYNHSEAYVDTILKVADILKKKSS